MDAACALPIASGFRYPSRGEKSEPVSFLITDCVSAVVALLPMRTIYRVVSPALDKVPHTQLSALDSAVLDSMFSAMSCSNCGICYAHAARSAKRNQFSKRCWVGEALLGVFSAFRGRLRATQGF